MGCKEFGSRKDIVDAETTRSGTLTADTFVSFVSGLFHLKLDALLHDVLCISYS